ncbi:hypothetical protein ACFPM0_21340 [Pseudonocardia sulfidoxydans]
MTRGPRTVDVRCAARGDRRVRHVRYVQSGHGPTNPCAMSRARP